ncbi:MAG TPA: hypothetical protein PLA01_09145 [Acetivibrio sp.]|nr:hypothetical protein [Acetivibrio sp.]
MIALFRRTEGTGTESKNDCTRWNDAVTGGVFIGRMEGFFPVLQN